MERLKAENWDQDEDKVQTLMQMGLTRVQAKIYLSLLYMGQGTIKGISQISKVSRQDIYQALRALETTGLVEKIISTPTGYRPVPIKEGASILLQNKNEELESLSKKADALSPDLSPNSAMIPNSEKDNEFILIPKKNCLRRDCKGCIVRSTLESAETTMETMNTMDAFKKYLLVGDNWYKALEKGVKIRILVSNPEGINPKLELGALKKRGSFEVRFSDKKFSTMPTLIDGKILLLKTEMDINASTLLSRNQCLVNIITEYFEDLWNQSLENSA